MGKIKVQATVNAPKQKAWDYYMKPEHITQWNFADPSWQCPSAENDMRVGGKYKARMEAKDGSFGFDFEAEYKKLNPGNSFSYVMPDGRQVDVEFKENNNQTDVDVVFDAESMNPEEMQKGGWQAILNNYKSYTESN